MLADDTVTVIGPLAIVASRPYARSTPRAYQPGSGMSAATNVPPPAGLSTRKVPVEDGAPIRQPNEAAAAGLCPADPVVTHFEQERAARDA